jgi:streptogramin lyase
MRSSVARVVGSVVVLTGLAWGCGSSGDATSVSGGTSTTTTTTTTCKAGEVACGGACVDTSSDPTHCGACGTTCAPGQACEKGACTLACAKPTTKCGDACVDTASDRASCGACGKACKAGEVCSKGACALSCQAGLTDCAGSCVDVKSDRAHCGACDKACKAGEVCSKGACALSCQDGLVECGGVCTDTKADRASCGACGAACKDGEVCSAGTCAASCAPPLVDCGGACVDVRYDPDHCGGCDTTCAAVPNAGRACVSGTCALGGCSQGFLDCDAKLANGCEIDARSDAKNCGGCGLACKVGEACCDSGCLTVMTDDKNCGGCSVACDMATKCCGGQCLDPAFSNVPSLDCQKPFQSVLVSGGQFQQQGSLDQLAGDANGITTIPAADNPPPAQSPFIWIAMHDSFQVNKVDAKTGKVLGTYPSRGHYPSRVAVALDNSVWVGNRGPDAPNDPNVSNLAQILPDGTPGCTITKAADGAPVPFVRAVAIDANGFVWFGTWNDQRLHKVDPAKCAVVGDYPMTPTIDGVAYTSYPYGLVVDRNGLLWNSRLNSGSAWLAMDTKALDPAKNQFVAAVPAPANACSYGIVIDHDGNVFMASCAPCGILHRIDGKTHAYSTVSNPYSACGNGMTIDVEGNVWEASPGQGVLKYKAGTGDFLARYSFPSFSNASGSGSFASGYGIAGDTYGKVWLTDYNTSSVVRFDTVGAVDVQTALPGKTCYNYSDWNAIVLKTVTSNNAQAGTWTKDYDSGKADTQWATSTWAAKTPPGTSVAVYFKAGASQADFANQKSCGPFYAQPVDLTACNFGPKRWLEATVVLNTNDVNVQPSMSAFQVYYQ